MNFKKNGELFNDFFNKQCSVVNSNIKLAKILTRKRCKSLSTVELLTSEMLNIIKNQNPNKIMFRTWHTLKS